MDDDGRFELDGQFAPMFDENVKIPRTTREVRNSRTRVTRRVQLFAFERTPGQNQKRTGGPNRNTKFVEADRPGFAGERGPLLTHSNPKFTAEFPKFFDCQYSNHR